MASSSSARFEEIRNENGILYKLRGRLSKNKTADIVMVPKTKMAYMHINDYTNSWDDGTYDKNSSKFVSLSMREATTLRQLMATMDPQVQALIQSAPPAGKKRKTTTENAQQIPAYYTSGQDQQIPSVPTPFGADQYFGQLPEQQLMGQQQPTSGQAMGQQYPVGTVAPQAVGQYQFASAQQNGQLAQQALVPQQPTATQAVGQQFPIGTVAPQQNQQQDFISQMFANYQ